MESVTGVNITPTAGKPAPESPGIFVEGPLSAAVIAEAVAKAGSMTQSGAHGIFLGQVRADATGESRVTAIEYSVYLEMALPVISEILHMVKAAHGLDQLIVHHSTGRVSAGEICFFVMATAGHRAAAMEGCAEAVNRIKSAVPVWGKILLQNGAAEWKSNTSVSK